MAKYSRTRPRRYMFEPGISSARLATIFGVSSPTVQRWRERGEFDTWRELPGGRFEVPLSAFLSFIERNDLSPEEPPPSRSVRRKHSLEHYDGPWITGREIARLHSVTSTTVHRWVKDRKEFPRYRTTLRDVEIPVPDYREWVARNTLRAPGR